MKKMYVKMPPIIDSLNYEHWLKINKKALNLIVNYLRVAYLQEQPNVIDDFDPEEEKFCFFLSIYQDKLN